jgi:hypothetical protein
MEKMNIGYLNFPDVCPVTCSFWYKKEIICSPCLKVVSTKRAHSRIPGLKGESIFLVLFFYVLSANQEGKKIKLSVCLCVFVCVCK